MRPGRWNLSPLEERWEAIESCERAYRDTRLRASTGNIGLAPVGDGLELVRAGRPDRPEMAAWRYGSTLVRRHRKPIVGMTLAIGAGVPMASSGAVTALATSVPAIAVLVQIPAWVSVYRQKRKVLATVQNDDALFIIRGKHLASARLAAAQGPNDEPWGLSIESDHGPLVLEGGVACRVASVVLARMNQAGGSSAVVNRAVQRLETAGGPTTLLTRAARASADWPTSSPLRWMEKGERLALEMATHEEAERRTLEGELKALALAWQDAERIAAISDELLLPERVTAFLQRYRIVDEGELDRSRAQVGGREGRGRDLAGRVAACDIPRHVESLHLLRQSRR